VALSLVGHATTLTGGRAGSIPQPNTVSTWHAQLAVAVFVAASASV